MLAVGALAIVVLIVAYLVFSGGGGADYHLEMNEAGQLVRGDQVQVGGVPVGSVTNIELTPDFKARITIHVDSSLTPLHEGTISEIRVPSLTGVANRYVALTPGPNNRPALAAGATLPASATREVVDLDQLFNTLNPQTRKGLQQFIQGSAEQYAGAGRALGKATEYFAPSFAAIDHFFAELVRDQSTFTDFLVESGKALTTIAARKESLSDLVEHADQTFQAIGSQQSNLALGLRRLPVTLNQGNKTFAESAADADRADAAGERAEAEHEGAHDPLRKAAPARDDGHAGRGQLQSGDLTAGAEQRPDRSVRGAARRSPRR